MKFIKEVLAELKFVKWPSKKSVFIGTLAVIIISAITAILLSGVDYIIAELLQLIVKK